MLPKQYRLSRKRDFKRAINKGRSFFIKEFGFKLLPKKINLPTRIGIVVPKKITKTIVRRNRLKRQIRHIFLRHINEMTPGFDIIFFTRPDFLKLSAKEAAEKVVNTLQVLKLINISKPD